MQKVVLREQSIPRRAFNRVSVWVIRVTCNDQKRVFCGWEVHENCHAILIKAFYMKSGDFRQFNFPALHFTWVAPTFMQLFTVRICSIFIPAQNSSTYRQVFVKRMLARDPFCRLTTQHRNNHYVAPHFPKLTDNPLHIMLVLLLILQHCNFYIFFVNNLFETFCLVDVQCG